MVFGDGVEISARRLRAIKATLAEKEKKAKGYPPLIMSYVTSYITSQTQLGNTVPTKITYDGHVIYPPTVRDNTLNSHTNHLPLHHDPAWQSCITCLKLGSQHLLLLYLVCCSEQHGHAQESSKGQGQGRGVRG